MVGTYQAPWLPFIIEHHQHPTGNIDQTMGGFLKAVLKTDGDVFVFKVQIAEDTNQCVTPEW